MTQEVKLREICEDLFNNHEILDFKIENGDVVMRLKHKSNKATFAERSSKVLYSLLQSIAQGHSGLPA